MLPEPHLLIRKARSPDGLNLSQKSLSADEAKRLADGMGEHVVEGFLALKRLDLSHNKISNDGAAAVVQKLGLGLTALDLSDCHLRGKDVPEQLAHTLNRIGGKTPCVLAELSLGNNQIGDAGVLELLNGFFDPTAVTSSSDEEEEDDADDAATVQDGSDSQGRTRPTTASTTASASTRPKTAESKWREWKPPKIAKALQAVPIFKKAKLSENQCVPFL